MLEFSFQVNSLKITVLFPSSSSKSRSLNSTGRPILRESLQLESSFLNLSNYFWQFPSFKNLSHNPLSVFQVSSEFLEYEMSSILHGHVHIFRREKLVTRLIPCEDITYLNLYEHLTACIFITYFRRVRIQFY